MALGVFFFLLINILMAKIPILAFWKWLKILEVAALAYFVFKESTFVKKVLNRFLVWVIIYESLIVAGQFLKQSSLGGIFWWLGERTFSLSTPGIAKGEFFGRLFLRPYGTFSHPNSLAGFSLVAIILTLPSIVKKNHLFSVLPRLKLGTIVCLLSSFSIIMLTFSRAVWLTGLFLGLIIFFIYFRRKKNFSQFFLVLSVLCLLLSVFLLKMFPLDESIFRRTELNQAAFKIIEQNIFFGVGLNNFIPQLAKTLNNFGWIYWLQPVHNIYLLAAAETGLIGLSVFLWLIILILKKLLISIRRFGGENQALLIKNWQLLVALTAILLTGLVDHYWLTLQQNFLLLGIIFGLGFK